MFNIAYPFEIMRNANFNILEYSDFSAECDAQNISNLVNVMTRLETTGPVAFDTQFTNKGTICELHAVIVLADGTICRSTPFGNHCFFPLYVNNSNGKVYISEFDHGGNIYVNSDVSYLDAINEYNNGISWAPERRIVAFKNFKNIL